MKYILILCLAAISFGQLLSQNINLNIRDYSTKKPISNAIVYTKGKRIAETNASGIAEIPVGSKNLSVSAPEYDTTEISTGRLNQTIYLLKRQQRIAEVKIKPIEDVFANNQIRRMMTNFEKLHPNNAPSYRFDVYSKLVIDAAEDSSSKKKTEADTELTAWIKHSKFFVWEKLTEYKHDKRHGEKRTVMASNMSGIKTPIYEVIAMTISDVNKLPWIFRDDHHKDFIFRLDDSLIIQQRKTYEINFFPQRKFKKNRRSRSGFVYIDSATGALMKYIGNTANGYAEIESELINGYCYNKNNYIKSNGMGGGAVEVNGGGVFFENITRIKNVTTNNQFIAKEFRGNETDISPNIEYPSSLDQLAKVRGPEDSLTARELNTFKSLDSIFEKEGVTKKLKLGLAALRGHIRIGGFNMSISDMIRYNQYEGLRFNIGGETNYSFHKNLYLGGYVGLGLRDQEFKGGASIRYMLDHYKQVQIQLTAQHDVFAIGRQMNEFSRSLDKIDFYTHQMFFEQYMRSQRLTLSLQHDVFRHMAQKTYARIEQINSPRVYQYQGTNLNDFTQLEAGIHLHYYPGSDYVTTSEGKFGISKKPTNFYLNYAFHYPTTTNISNYHTLDMMARSYIKHPIGGMEWNVFAGMTSQNTPLYHMYEGMGASPTNDPLYRSFGLGSMHYFVTMQPSTFYSNYYAAGMIRQSLPTLKFSESFRIKSALKYAAIIGDQWNAQDHNWNTIAPHKLYQELGLEIDNVLAVFGLGFYYRVGAYSNPGFENNLAGRLIIGF